MLLPPFFAWSRGCRERPRRCLLKLRKEKAGKLKRREAVFTLVSGLPSTPAGPPSPGSMPLRQLHWPGRHEAGAGLSARRDAGGAGVGAPSATPASRSPSRVRPPRLGQLPPARLEGRTPYVPQNGKFPFTLSQNCTSDFEAAG